MKKLAAWIMFISISLLLFLYFLLEPKVQIGGDIIEYFGVSESLINHQGLNLDSRDKANLISRLGKGYFDNPEYYLTGKDGQNYAVHFPLYSVVNLPMRILLKAIDADEFKMFRLTNLLVLTIASLYILKKYCNTALRKFSYLFLIYLSPLIWHLVWPGPEVFSSMLILLSVFLFMKGDKKQKVWAIIISSIASYQSQPLVFIPLSYLIIIIFEKYEGVLRYFKYDYLRINIKENINNNLHAIRLQLVFPNPKEIILGLILILAMIIPNIYYFALFGTFSSWSKLSDVGFANISVKKYIELFFDPNIGLFFYAPVIFLGGILLLLYSVNKEKKNIFLLGAIILTTIFYLINTNWNSGTAGFGPSRYSLFLLPFLVYFVLDNLRKGIHAAALIILVLITQLYIMNFNGYLMPDFGKTIVLTPYAKEMLNRFPAFYNPTYEIFVERVSQKEGGFWDTTIYKNNGKCRKAYVLITSTQKLKNECGYIPDAFQMELENEYLNKTNYPRNLITTEAVFYPAESSCAWDYQTGNDHPFVCMHTINDVLKYTNIKDMGRVEKVTDDPGVWKMKWGKPVSIIVPAGYIVNHYSFTGAYVNY